MLRIVLMSGLLAFGLVAVPGRAAAQEAKPPATAAPTAAAPAAAPLPEPPYEARLLRLAEIIGSVHYLRNLCDSSGERDWRQTMAALLDSETAGEPARREKLTAGFNRGYRAFASVYSTCTPSAVTAEERYRREGATLASEIVARFGN